MNTWLALVFIGVAPQAPITGDAFLRDFCVLPAGKDKICDTICLGP